MVGYNFLLIFYFKGHFFFGRHVETSFPILMQLPKALKALKYDSRKKKPSKNPNLPPISFQCCQCEHYGGCGPGAFL